MEKNIDIQKIDFYIDIFHLLVLRQEASLSKEFGQSRVISLLYYKISLPAPMSGKSAKAETTNIFKLIGTFRFRY